jgi:class 3 adenylate cyclase
MSYYLHVLSVETCNDIELGNCVKKNMTIMFSDIRGFTSISENMTPE